MSWRLMCSLLVGISAAASVSCDAGPVIQRPAGAGGAASPRTTAEATPQSAASLDPTRASSTLPAQSATSPAVYGGTVHHDIRVWVFIDPLTARRDNQFLFGEVFSGLVSISGGALGVASPELAESWTVSGDGLTYTFRLRDGLRFSDGTPLSAEDVKWSWERALAPENATEEAKEVLGAIEGAAEILRGSATNLRGVTVVDDATLSVVLVRPQGHFLFLMAHPIASVLSEANVDRWDTLNWVEFQDTLIQDTSRSTDFKELPVGTGPFRIVNYVAPVSTRLEPNPFHWRNTPSVDRIILSDRYHPASGVSRAPDDSEFDRFAVGFEAYEAYASDTLDGSQSDFPENLVPRRFQTAPGVAFVALNTAIPPFDDVEFRRALRESADRSPISDGLQPDAPTSAASGLLYPADTEPSRNRSAFQSAPNRQDALRRLRQSRYADETSSYVLTHYSDGSSPKRFLGAFGRYWDEWLGLALDVWVEDRFPEQEFAEALADGTLQMRYVHVEPRYPDPCAILCRIPDLFGPNALSDETERLREMLHDAAATADRAARIAKYQAIEAHILDRALVIPAYWDDGAVYELVRPYISGYKIPAYGGSRYEDVVVDTTHPDYPADR